MRKIEFKTQEGGCTILSIEKKVGHYLLVDSKGKERRLTLFELLAYLPVISRDYDDIGSYCLDYDDIQVEDLDVFKDILAFPKSYQILLWLDEDGNSVPGYPMLRPYIVSAIRMYHTVAPTLCDVAMQVKVAKKS
jgi:hypothetical protein